MTCSELIASAEKLVRKSFVYTRAGRGDDVAGYWFNRSDAPLRFAFHYLNELYFILPYRPDFICFDHRKIIEMDHHVDLRKAVPLTKKAVPSYPSLDYLFYFGDEKIQEWLKKKGWNHEYGWNGNFKEQSADEYNEWWQASYPIYSDDDLYALEGGWPMTWPDDDMPLLCKPGNEFVLCTLKDPEPWIEIYVENKPAGNGSFQGYWRNT